MTDCGCSKPSGEGVLWRDQTDWGNGYVSLINAKLNLYHFDKRIRVINKGISGNKSDDLVNRLEQDVISYNPDWVVILIGINDVWRHFDSNSRVGTTKEDYRNNLINIINKVFTVTKNIVLVTPYLVQKKNESKMRIMMDSFADVVRDLAKDYDLFLVDLQEKFDEKLVTHDMSNLTVDRIHPTLAGHMLIADSILEVIGGNEYGED